MCFRDKGWLLKFEKEKVVLFVNAREEWEMPISGFERMFWSFRFRLRKMLSVEVAKWTCWKLGFIVFRVKCLNYHRLAFLNQFVNDSPFELVSLNYTDCAKAFDDPVFKWICTMWEYLSVMSFEIFLWNLYRIKDTRHSNFTWFVWGKNISDLKKLVTMTIENAELTTEQVISCVHKHHHESTVLH